MQETNLDPKDSPWHDPELVDRAQGDIECYIALVGVGFAGIELDRAKATGIPGEVYAAQYALDIEEAYLQNIQLQRDA